MYGRIFHSLRTIKKMFLHFAVIQCMYIVQCIVYRAEKPTSKTKNEIIKRQEENMKLSIMAIQINKLRNKQKKQYERFYFTGNSKCSTASETN
jgi:hypothetical protein